MAETKIKSAIGIEFTGDHISLVKLAKTAEGIVLVEARSIKSSLSKKEEDKKVLVENTVKAFEGLNFEKDEISLGVGGHTSFVRRVKLPPVSHSKLKQVVSFEVQQQVPFSLSEVRWDYQVVFPISKIPGPVIVLIAAIKQSFAEDLIKLLQESINKTPDIVDTSSLALHNCLIFNDLLSKEKVGILMNFGYSYTDVSIENKGEIAFTRAVPIGRRNILRKIAEARKVELEKAEEILETEDVSSVILPIWEDLIAEIKRTTTYYLSQVEKVTHFQYMYVSGEFPKNPNIYELLNNAFKIEIKEVNPFNKIRYNPEALASNVSNFSVSTGLALRLLERSSVEINLLPIKILSQKKLANKRLYFIASFVALFLIGSFMLALDARSYNFTKEKISIAKPILDTYTPYISKLDILKKEQQTITSQLKNIEGVLKQKSQLSEILLEVSELTPSDIYITEISTATFTPMTGRSGRGDSSGRVPTGGAAATRYNRRSVPTMAGETGRETSSPALENVATSSGSKISLSGVTASYPTVGEYIKQLNTSALFKTVELISVSSTLEAGQSGRATHLTAMVRGATATVRSARATSQATGASSTVQKEEVKFILEIGLEK